MDHLVQSNYAGWALGAMVFPYSVSSAHDLIDLQFLQAVGVSAAFGLYLAVYGRKRRGTEIAGRAASVCLAVFVCLSVSLTLCLCACASECLCDACTFVPQPQSDTAGHAEHPGFTDGMKMLARSRQYVLQCLCYSCACSVQHMRGISVQSLYVNHSA